MLERFRLRHRITQSLRKFLDDNGFMDVETPVLTRTTPEGARDYIVPSRTHPGQFFALPQSPQLFKQILMMSGFDRYYQIARCFRDEDLRADRQPEFTQIDIETSFMNEHQFMEIMETMIRTLFREVAGIELPPLPRMTYAEAIARFGIDRPDLSIPLELVEVADLMTGVEFKVFAGPAADPDGRVTALKIPGGGTLTRKEIDDYTAFVAQLRREGPRLHQGQRGGEGPGRPAVADHEVPAGRDGAGADHAPRTEGRRPGVLRRRQEEGRQRLAGGAAREGRPRPEDGQAGLAPAVGRGLPHVRVGPQGEALGARCITRSPRRPSTTWRRWRRTRARRCPAPTTWS